MSGFGRANEPSPGAGVIARAHVERLLPRVDRVRVAWILRTALRCLRRDLLPRMDEGERFSPPKNDLQSIRRDTPAALIFYAHNIIASNTPAALLAFSYNVIAFGSYDYLATLSPDRLRRLRAKAPGNSGRNERECCLRALEAVTNCTLRDFERDPNITADDIEFAFARALYLVEQTDMEQTA